MIKTNGHLYLLGKINREENLVIAPSAERKCIGKATTSGDILQSMENMQENMYTQAFLLLKKIKRYQIKQNYG